MQTAGNTAFVQPAHPGGLLLGESTAMHNVFRLIERVAPTDVGVLLTGESGSGKELAAQAIHQYSPRRASPFIAMSLMLELWNRSISVGNRVRVG